MIRDFNDFENGSSISSDFCFIGAGAAGIAIAREFLGTPYTVTLLESGGLHNEPESNRLYDSEIVGLPHAGVHSGRERVFGGTTTVWGGQTLRFGKFDFQPRCWVPFSGWPIPREELDPYYDRADRLLKLRESLNYEDVYSDFGISPPPFDPQKLSMQFSQWSPKPNFGTAYRRDLQRAHNISVLLHANVTAIATNSSASAVEQVEFSTLSGKIGVARARFFVICCGGIENARILLASDRIQPHGIGNDHDVVGRYFQEHVTASVGALGTYNRPRLQDLFESFFIRGVKYAPIINLAHEAQTKNRLLSVHGILSFGSSPDSCIQSAKALYRSVVCRTYPDNLKSLLRNISANPRELIDLVYRRSFQKRAATAKQGLIALGVHAEMAPNPDSRVTLSETRDQLGMRRVKLDWRLSEFERRSILGFANIACSEFERLDLGTFDHTDRALLEDHTTWVRRAHDNFHHMGTTRMHNDPKLGVVDSNCCVHGVANLYIGGSSVFPTCGTANPTLTILALCLRIADRLKQLS
jgi:choline dehydrogenase-like flavoprotein